MLFLTVDKVPTLDNTIIIIAAFQNVNQNKTELAKPTVHNVILDVEKNTHLHSVAR